METNRCILCLKRLCLWSKVNFEAQNRDFLSFFSGAGQVIVTNGVWISRSYRQVSFQMDPDHQEQPFKIYSDSFYVISGLYFASRRLEMHFLRHFRLKIAKWQLQRKFELNIRAHNNLGLWNNHRPPRKAFVDIFWRVFLISGLYFAQNQSEMHFLCYLQ